MLLSTLSFTAIAFRDILRIKHSSSDEATAGHRGTCDNRSVVAASAGSRTGVQQAMGASSHQPWPWSYPGQSTVESGGDALKTGRVTDALVQCPKLCPCISPEVVPVYVTSWTRRRESGRPSTLPPISHGVGVALELPWSIYSGVWG